MIIKYRFVYICLNKNGAFGDEKQNKVNDYLGKKWVIRG